MRQNGDSFYLFVNKPVGLTSQACLKVLKKKYGFKKIGHHGTLDPFASGLLLVGVNEATKFFPFIKDEEKTYEAVVKLGEETDTLDVEGVVVQRRVIPELSVSGMQEVAKTFLGRQLQTPPLYSAVKVAGKEAYKWARENKDVVLSPREICVNELVVLSWEKPYVKFLAKVSRGTYIRVLARDLARSLGTVGHAVTLVRTELCGSAVAQSCELDGDILAKKISVLNFFLGYPKIELSADEAKIILQGGTLNRGAQGGGGAGERLSVATSKGYFLGFVADNDGVLKPKRLTSYLN